MTKLERITFTVPTDMADKIRTAVDSGSYATASEVVREALRDWSDEREKQETENALMREVLAKARSGKRYTADEVYARLHKRIDEIEGRNASRSAA